MILKNKTAIIVSIILLAIFTLTFWICSLDIPSTFTAAELFSKMADNLLKVGLLFLYLVSIYAIIFVLGIMTFIVTAIYHICITNRAKKKSKKR